jgi:hypothetical protein
MSVAASSPDLFDPLGRGNGKERGKDKNKGDRGRGDRRTTARAMTTKTATTIVAVQIVALRTGAECCQASSPPWM